MTYESRTPPFFLIPGSSCQSRAKLMAQRIIAWRLKSNAKANRHTPSPASNLNSLMFLCLELFRESLGKFSIFCSIGAIKLGGLAEPSPHPHSREASTALGAFAEIREVELASLERVSKRN
jgi:hypothetical protein